MPADQTISTDLSASEVELVYNIKAIAENFPKEFQRLGRIAKKYITHHSWSADLRIAHEYLRDYFRWHRSGRIGLVHARTTLIHSAIILYARVFDNSSRFRGGFRLPDTLTAEQSALHQKIVSNRNESVAHFGPAGTSSAWSEDMLVVIRQGDRWQPAVIARRSLADHDFAVKFESHIAHIEQKLQPLLIRLREDFQNEFARCWEIRPDFDKLLMENQLSPDVLSGWDGPVLSGPRKDRMTF